MEGFPHIPDMNADGFQAVFTWIMKSFGWVIQALHHFYIFPKLRISLLAFIVALIVLGLIFDAIFVKFENAADEGFDLPE